MPRRTLPSFTLVLSSRRDSFSLPDYYRQTRVENYGPYYRESVPDSMKTTDLRGRESIEYDQSFLLPDIFEDEEIEIIDAKPTQPESGLNRANEKDQEREAAQARGQPKRSRWLCRLFSSLLGNYHRHKVHPVNNMGADSHLDLSD